MTNETPHQTIADAITALSDAAIHYVSTTWPAVELRAPKTYGERMQEMEWEIQHLKEDRDNLAAELDARGQRIVDLTSQVDYWHDDAEGLRESNVAAYEALPSYVKRAHVGMSLGELVGKLAEYQKVDQELRESLTEEAQQSRNELADIREALSNTPTLVTINNDSGRIDPVPTIEHMVRVIRNRETNAAAEYERLRQEHNALQKTHHEWVNGQRQKPPSLNDLMTKMNDVIRMQIESFSPTKGTARTVDIRRRRLAERSPVAELQYAEDGPLLEAAIALVTGSLKTWPWGDDAYNEIVAEDAQLPTAAALIITHYDATRAA